MTTNKSDTPFTVSQVYSTAQPNDSAADTYGLSSNDPAQPPSDQNETKTAPTLTDETKSYSCGLFCFDCLRCCAATLECLHCCCVSMTWRGNFFQHYCSHIDRNTTLVFCIGYFSHLCY
ncbi:unnamed protein product [Rotaria magnacalcarata]|uniref:Uncharacterized protein n=2 Tax=Rotaria magnacalcarata TaxID=392030 RepID=A0A815IY03_9BILA|nr:unnamed protein product [Rotaria magnacalcarata]